MGQFGEYVKMALYSIRSNKGRSFLTMLGIIIGISSVITIISIGSGLKADVMAETNEKSVGIMVNPDETANTELITPEDIAALKEQLGTRARGIIYSASAAGGVSTRKGSFDAYVTLTTPDAQFDPAQKEIFRGSYFTEDDAANAALVCVLDKGSAIYLFGTPEVEGMEFDLNIENTIQTVKICGIRDMDDELMAANEQAMKMFGMEMPIMLEMPYSVAENWGESIENFPAVTVYLGENAKANQVTGAAINLLNARHLSDGENLFQKQQSMDISNYMGTVLDGVTAFIAFVAGISLLVGGIGVMNIMLVSVTERTREIGIRKALGAKTGSIVAQFLCESAIISGIGGIIGILIGAGLSGLVGLLNIGGLSARISPLAVLLTTCFSCGVGIIFGIYPARKAARLSPIEALRQL